MADNSYTLEFKRASSNGYHTPAQARAYYGRYSREGFTVHWWNTRDKVANTVAGHDQTVNYIYNKSVAGTGSVNYVVSDFKITYMVSPDNVAWASQSGNPTTISCEFSPHLSAEGYKKAGWLIDQLEQRYGHKLTLYPHKHWYATACPGDLDINRMRAEADKWKRGDYDRPTPIPTPTPTPVPTPVGPTEHDKLQDAKISALTALVEKVVSFLESVFTAFKR